MTFKNFEMKRLLWSILWDTSQDKERLNKMIRLHWTLLESRNFKIESVQILLEEYSLGEQAIELFYNLLQRVLQPCKRKCNTARKLVTIERTNGSGMNRIYPVILKECAPRVISRKYFFGMSSSRLRAYSSIVFIPKSGKQTGLTSFLLKFLEKLLEHCNHDMYKYKYSHS